MEFCLGALRCALRCARKRERGRKRERSGEVRKRLVCRVAYCRVAVLHGLEAGPFSIRTRWLNGVGLWSVGGVGTPGKAEPRQVSRVSTRTCQGPVTLIKTQESEDLPGSPVRTPTCTRTYLPSLVFGIGTTEYSRQSRGSQASFRYFGPWLKRPQHLQSNG